MTTPARPDQVRVGDVGRGVLLRRGVRLEQVTLAWNAAGIAVLAVAAARARSIALAGFGLDSLVEIGASTVVLWELSGTGPERQRRALRLIAYAFWALAGYLAVQAVVALLAGYHPRHSPLGIAWTAATAVVMFTLAGGKARTGRTLGNPVLTAEGRVASARRRRAQQQPLARGRFHVITHPLTVASGPSDPARRTSTGTG